MRALVAAVCLLGAAVGLTAQTEWPSERPPRPLPARDVNFPPYQIQTLPNGLRVVAVLHHEQPVVSLRMIVGAGSALDPRDKLGMAQLAASLLTQGTTTQSASELNDAVDFIGGIMGAGAGSDHTLLNMVVMKDSFQNGLRMLSDLARRPAFSPEEIERQRQQTLSSLTVSFEDPAFIADAVFARLVYGFHPYGLPQSGTPQTIGSVTRDDLVEYHRKYFVPNNAILAVVGDVTADEAFGGVKAAFGDWERRELPPTLVADPPEPTRRVVVINKPDAVQTEVRAGHIGVRRNHPDYMPLNLAIRVLGGEGANRLHQVLRTERGLTYGAQADMHVLREAGDFEASTNTRSEATGQVLRLMVDEFWKLVRERVGERELSDAKAYMAGSFPLTIEIPDAIATRVLNVLFYGLPVDELQTFRERVNAVTVDDIHRVSRLALRPDRSSIVLVGNAAAFTADLKRIGFQSFEVVDIGDLDLTAVDFRRRGTGAPPRPAAGAQLVPRERRVAYRQTGAGGSSEPARSARSLLEAVIAAKGGLETLRALTTIKAVTTTSMATPRGEVKSETTTWLEYPSRVRVETRLPEATIVQVFDGERAWIQDPAGTHQLPSEAIREMQTSLKRDTIGLLLAVYDGNVHARLLPDVKDESGTRHRVLECSDTDLEPIVLYVDPVTHLVSKQAYVAGRPGEALIEEVFSDYRKVDGVQIAFTAKVRRGGQPVLERRITDFSLRSPFEPSLFKRPGFLTARLLLSCGEPSGDLYAGALTRELRALGPHLDIAGLGGPEFAAAGGHVLEDYRGLSATGLTEGIAKIPRLLAALRHLVASARTDRPDGLIVIDFPEINFRLARQIKALGVRVVFYISPQIWAWRPGRLETIRQLADRVLVIFPFEEAIYREAGVPVEFVGHPLVDLAKGPTEGPDFLRAVRLSPDAPTVAVLPGSRPNEVARILPDLVAACQRIQSHVRDAQFVVARAPSLDDSLFDVIQRQGLTPAVVVEGKTDAVLAAADVALTASGTATVQTALHDTPMVVVYRLSPTTYRLGRRLVKVDMFAMVNLIAGERIVPELIQDAFTPKAVADEAISMLTDPARAADIREGLARVRARLGGPGASRRAAEAILRVVSRSPDAAPRPVAGG